jgi:hypothetical protein
MLNKEAPNTTREGTTYLANSNNSCKTVHLLGKEDVYGKKVCHTGFKGNQLTLSQQGKRFFRRENFLVLEKYQETIVSGLMFLYLYDDK